MSAFALPKPNNLEERTKDFGKLLEASKSSVNNGVPGCQEVSQLALLQMYRLSFAKREYICLCEILVSVLRGDKDGGRKIIEDDLDTTILKNLGEIIVESGGLKFTLEQLQDDFDTKWDLLHLVMIVYLSTLEGEDIGALTEQFFGTFFDFHLNERTAEERRRSKYHEDILVWEILLRAKRHSREHVSELAKQVGDSAAEAMLRYAASLAPTEPEDGPLSPQEYAQRSHYLMRALELNPLHVLAAARRIWLCARQGEFAEAENAFEALDARVCAFPVIQQFLRRQIVTAVYWREWAYGRLRQLTARVDCAAAKMRRLGVDLAVLGEAETDECALLRACVRAGLLWRVRGGGAEGAAYFLVADPALLPALLLRLRPDGALGGEEDLAACGVVAQRLCGPVAGAEEEAEILAARLRPPPLAAPAVLPVAFALPATLPPATPTCAADALVRQRWAQETLSAAAALSAWQRDLAALAAHHSASLASGKRIRDHESLCVVCFERERRVVLLPCGHCVLCAQCEERHVHASATASASPCPICKLPVRATVLARHY